MSELQWPYDLPIWRPSHRASSPDGRFVAEIDPAHEVSMGNPTSGVLRLSGCLRLERCSPSFIWSDDSRFLAVPRFEHRFGLFRRSRLLLVDTLERRVTGSTRTAWYFQPETFAQGLLVVTTDPFGQAKRVSWRIPEDVTGFRTIRVEWAETDPTDPTPDRAPPRDGPRSSG